MVVAWSALHGFQSGSLRRMAGYPALRPVVLLRHAGAVILGGVAAIVMLVVLKP